MKMIRTAALVAAAAAAISRAKDYARENPEKASETIDKAESFVRGKAGPKYADKVGKGSSALRRSLGLSAGSSTGVVRTLDDAHRGRLHAADGRDVRRLVRRDSGWLRPVHRARPRGPVPSTDARGTDERLPDGQADLEGPHRHGGNRSHEGP